MLAKKRQRIGFILTFCIILSMVLSACAAPVAPAAPAPAAESGSGEQAADPGARALPDDAAEDQTIRYVTRNFSRLNPASEGGFGRPWISFMWMTMFLNDRENNIKPWLATDYSVSDDGLSYTINIHPGAVWSDGSPVLAQEAVDYSLVSAK